MKRLLLVFSIAISLTAAAALAQHENMPGHDSMDGGHANMPPGDKPMPDGNKPMPDGKKMGGGKQMGNMDHGGTKQEPPKPVPQKK